MKPILFKVTGKFVEKATGKPLSGGEYRAWLYDKDPLSDDKLGEGALDENGQVEITCDLSDVSSWDSPGETHPDLFFILLRHGKEIFRTPVYEDVEPFVTNPFSREKRGIDVFLGTFEV